MPNAPTDEPAATGHHGLFAGLKSRFDTFKIQRRVNTYAEEPLLAILPGGAVPVVADGDVESALSVITTSIVMAGLIGMVTMLMAVNERRHEMAILRSVGARPHHVFAFRLRGRFRVHSRAVWGTLLYACMITLPPVIESRYGLFIPINPLSINECICVVAAGILAV